MTRLSPAPLALLALALASCSKEEASRLVEIELPESAREFRITETSMQRFRMRPRETPAEAPAGVPKLVHDTPEGWTAAPTTSMREVNFTFGPAGEGEVYLTRLTGAGGGMVANVNRWRSQMGAAALSPEEVEALPRRPLFGQPATFVSVDGTFSPGMGSSQTFPDYRLMGVILASDKGAVFVKMTGPKALVEQNAAAFDQFVGSLDIQH